MSRLVTVTLQLPSTVWDAYLARVHVFRKRLPMMYRHGWDGPTNSNSGMAFAWFVWDRNHSGPTELHRLSWVAAE